MGIELGNNGINAPIDNLGSAVPSPDNWQSYPVITDIENKGPGTSISFFVPIPGARRPERRGRSPG